MLLRRARQVGHLDGGARYGSSDDIVERDFGMIGLGGRREERMVCRGISGGGTRTDGQRRFCKGESSDCAIGGPENELSSGHCTVAPGLEVERYVYIKRRRYTADCPAVDSPLGSFDHASYLTYANYQKTKPSPQ